MKQESPTVVLAQKTTCELEAMETMDLLREAGFTSAALCLEGMVGSENAISVRVRVC